jgi:hypothetical protein
MVDRGLYLQQAGVGCLVGETQVTINRNGKSYQLRLDVLVDRYLGRVRPPGPACAYDDGKTRVRCLRSDGTIGLAPLVGVLDSGVMPVLRVRLSDGRSVVLTHGHEVVTPAGKVRAHLLNVGDVVLVDSWKGRPDHWGTGRAGKRGVEGGRKSRKPFKTEDGRYVDRDGYVLARGTRLGPKRWMYEHRVVMERELGRDLLTSEHVHHINHVRTDNRPVNLQVTTKREHALHHVDRGQLPGVRPDFATVVSVEDAGEEHVYDLSIDDPAHTWIGDRVVVGNTGKTVMTIAAVERLAEEFDDFYSVVVCQSTLKTQWVKAIRRFTCATCAGESDERLNDPTVDHDHVPTATYACIDGTPDKRWDQYQAVIEKPPRYIVMAYDSVVDDWSQVVRIKPMCVTIDEATVIKNPDAKITCAVREVFGDTPFRYGLTGTPMENGRPEELFQLMVWIDDSVLGRADLFDSTFVRRDSYGRVLEYTNLEVFHDLMSECSSSIDPDSPAVAQYMPEPTPTHTVLIELDAASAFVYETMCEDLVEDLQSMRASATFDVAAHYGGGAGSDMSDTGKVMSKISCMRMLCAGPLQLVESARLYQSQCARQIELDEAAEAHQIQYGEHGPDDCPASKHEKGWPTVKKVIKGNSVRVPKDKNGSAYAASLLDAGYFDDLDQSPKAEEILLDVRQVLLGECHCCTDLPSAATVNKVVVFSYHKRLLRQLEADLGPVAVRFDGDLPHRQRDENKRRFQTEPGVRVFLTSDAGGYGVDLPQGNHLFNADKPFTAGRVTQRNARIRRANKEFHDVVHTRDYLVAGSIEIYYAEITNQKARVARAVQTGKGHTKGSIMMNAGGLAEFLRTHRV